MLAMLESPANPQAGKPALRGVVDNRYLIASLITFERDTSRVVGPEIFGSTFDLEER
jgi:hypothetical protein